MLLCRVLVFPVSIREKLRAINKSDHYSASNCAEGELIKYMFLLTGFNQAVKNT